jgi:hypothetical protein
MIFPRQDIPEIQKNEAWYKQALDYAESRVKINMNTYNAHMTDLYNSYNGIASRIDSMNWLTHTYGKENRAKFVRYRVGSTKVKLLWGEFLRRPLSATIQTINSSAVTEKMRQFNFMKGAMVAKQELEEVRDKVGVDVMEGVPIPADENDPIWEKMSFKDKYEEVMQLILDQQVKDLSLKRKSADMFKDVLITSMCYAKVEIDENGDVQVFKIDPRDAIYEYIEGDDFLQQSPVKGARQTMSVEQILLRYELTDSQRNQLNAARENPEEAIQKSRGYMSMQDGQLCCDVIHIEWDGLSAEYIKEAPKRSSQMILDDGEGTVQMQLNTERYEKTKKEYDKIAKKEGFTITTKWKKDRYEATRIGGIIDVNCRRKPFQPRNQDNPTELLSSSYVGFVFGTTDGVRISLQQEIQNFDNMFDICMYQILKELNRAKGKIIGYDQAGQPANKTTNEILYEAMHDQIVFYNSASAGNYGGRPIDPSTLFKTMDLGMSDSFPQLIAMKNDIINNLNQITGINESREGNIAASATATNAQSQIANSRTITEPMFYGMNEFVQRLLQSVVDHSAVSWAFYKTEKGEQILGADKFKFLRVTHEMGYQNYSAHIEDGSKYMEITQNMKELIGFSLNAKEIRPMDALKFNLAETMAEKKQVLEQSWADMQAIVQQSQERDIQAQNENAQMQQQTQLQIAQENREDIQNASKEDIVLKGQVQMEVDNNKARNSMTEQQIKSQNDLLTNNNTI